MKKPPASVYAIIIGLLLGYQFAKTTHRSGGNKDDGNGGDVHVKISRKSDSTRASRGRKGKHQSHEKASAGLKTLMHVTSGYYGAPPDRKFYDAVEAINLGDI